MKLPSETAKWTPVMKRNSKEKPCVSVLSNISNILQQTKSQQRKVYTPVLLDQNSSLNPFYDTLIRDFSYSALTKNSDLQKDTTFADKENVQPEGFYSGEKDKFSTIQEPLKESKSSHFLSLPQREQLDATTQGGGCNCKNSYCQKLYCSCFRNGKSCVNCNCVGCKNVDNSEESQREKKIVYLFQQKANQKNLLLLNGCSCQNTSCQKKYCDCFKYGLKCSSSCKCKSCLNEKIKADGKAVADAEQFSAEQIRRTLLTKLQQIKNKFN